MEISQEYRLASKIGLSRIGSLLHLHLASPSKTLAEGFREGGLPTCTGFDCFMVVSQEYCVAKGEREIDRLAAGVSTSWLGQLSKSLYATDAAGGSGQRTQYFDRERKSVLIDEKWLSSLGHLNNLYYD
jgi:hypothetical protein